MGTIAQRLLTGFVLSVCAFIFVFTVGTAIVKAAPATPASGSCKTSFFGIPTWYEYIGTTNNCEINIKNDVTSTDADGNTVINSKYNFKVIWLIALAVFDMLLTVAGIIAVVFVMVGGFKFVIAQGSPDKIANARNTIYNALIGVVIAIIASQTVGFIANQFIKGTGVFGLPGTSGDASTLTTALNIFLTILGAVCVLMITISGFQFIISTGEPQKTAKARSSIIYALVGLAIALFAAVIVNFVLDKVI